MSRFLSKLADARLRLFINFGLAAVVASTALTIVGCESEDDNKILGAQLCFNDVDDTQADAAIDAAVDKCFDKIAGIESQDAYTIRCSGEFLKGGLTTAKLVTAFKNYDDQPVADREAYLVEQLALGSEAEADAAYAYCKKTGIPGLNYVATLSRLGTKIASAAAGTTEQNIDACIATPASCDLESVGEMVVDMADLYCKGDATEQQICIDIASAQAAAGTDYEAIALALLAQIHP